MYDEKIFWFFFLILLLIGFLLVLLPEESLHDAKELILLLPRKGMP